MTASFVINPTLILFYSYFIIELTVVRNFTRVFLVSKNFVEIIDFISGASNMFVQSWSKMHTHLLP